MHGCYVSARNRDARIARVAVMLAQCSRSRVRCEWPRHVRQTLAASQMVSLIFSAAKRPKSHLTTGNRSLSSNIMNFSACRFENPHPSACLIEASSC